MNRTFFWILFCIGLSCNAQNIIDWDGKYELQREDFQSVATQIGNTNIYSLHTAAHIDFSFYMSNAEFMFTRNFNSKVNCVFNKEASSLVAPNDEIAEDLVEFARYEFDLSELYSRKFRKKLYEEKSTFSGVSFVKPAFDEMQKEFNSRDTMAGKITDLGRNREELSKLRREVLAEIEQLSDFCKTCKPAKKKK